MTPCIHHLASGWQYNSAPGTDADTHQASPALRILGAVLRPSQQQGMHHERVLLSGRQVQRCVACQQGADGVLLGNRTCPGSPYTKAARVGKLSEECSPEHKDSLQAGEDEDEKMLPCLFTAAMLLPSAIRARAVATWPWYAARWSGVLPVSGWGGG